MTRINYDSFTWAKNLVANEDSLIAGVHEDVHFFAVADGVGSCLGGDIASGLAVKKVEAIIHETQPFEMHNIFNEIYDNLKEVASLNEGLSRMGTTLTLCIINNAKALIGHVGDSRLYVIRNNVIAYKTTDQTLTQSFIDKGIATRIINNRHNNMLTSVLSPSHDFVLEDKSIQLYSGDRIVLCSDGIYTCLSDTDLLTLSSKSNDSKSLILKIKAALRIHGLTDDSSAICIDYL